MPRVVHKQEFSLFRTRGVFSLPESATVVGFALRGDYPAFWYERDAEDTTSVEWELMVVGTGVEWPGGFEYLAGPALSSGSVFVFHLVGKRA